MLTRLASCSVLMLAFGPSPILSQNDVPGVDAGQDRAADLYGPPERIIYVPFDRFSDVYQQEDASVVLRYADYLKLLKLESEREQVRRRPADAVITRATYTATIEQDFARIQAALTVSVTGKPWVEVPLNFGEAAIGAVMSDDGEVLLRGTGEGTYALLFKTPGEQRVRLDLTARVATSPEGRQIDLDCPPAAITTFEISVPRADQQIEVRPRLLQQPVDSGADETRVSASLGATGHIAAAWRPRETAKPQMQLLASVTNRQRYHLADGVIQADAWLTYEILRGELQQLRIVVPVGHRILDVAASVKVQGWESAETDDGQILTVELLNPAEDQVTVEVHTEQRLEETLIRIGGYQAGGVTAGIHALDVVRESGQIVVSRANDLSVRVTEQAGVSRIEPDQVAQEIRHADALAYKYYSPAFALALSVARVEPRVSVGQLLNLVLGEDELGMTSQLSYAIDRAGVFELRIGVPEGLVIDDVRSDHLQEFRVVDGMLVIVLRERTLGSVRVTIDAHQALDKASTELTLPIPEPLDVERETGIVQLFADDSIEVATHEETLEAARPAPVSPQLVQAAGAARLRAAWQFSRRPVVIPVTVTRKPARLSAAVATDVLVEPTRTRVTTLIDFQVEFAGLDRFRISIPEEARDTLQVESVALVPTSPSLKSQQPGEPIDGWIPYTLVMQREVFGRQRFQVIYDLQPTELVVPAADNQSGDDAVTGNENGNGGAEPAPGGTEPIEAAPAGGPPANSDDKDPSPGADGGASSDADGNTGAAEDVARQPSREGEAPAADDVVRPSAGDAAGPNGTATGDAAEADVVDADAGADAGVEDASGTQIDPQQLQLSLRTIRPLESVSDDGVSSAISVSRVTGEIRIQKEQTLTITAEATGADVEPIDIRELTALPQDGTFAFRYRKHPPEETITVDLTQTRYDVHKVIATVVSRALVEVVLGEDLTATYRCRYRLKSTERQRLRVELPKGIEVLSVLVDGGEVRLEPDSAAAPSELADTYFVRIAREGASDTPFTLMLQFLWTVHPKPFDRGLQGTIRLPLPRIGEQEASAVQQTRVVVWVPKDYALIGDPLGFSLLGRTPLRQALWEPPILLDPAADDSEWISGESKVLLDFPTTGRVAYRYSNLGGDLEHDPTITLLWWNTLWYTVVVSLAIALIGWVLLRTSWENKLGVLLLLAFLGVLLGLKSEHVLAHVLSAARFGLVFLLGLWLLGALFGKRRGAEANAGSATGASWRMTGAGPPHVAVVPPPGVFKQHHSQETHDHDHR